MEDLTAKFHEGLSSGAAINLREFEKVSLISNPSVPCLVFHLYACYLTNQLNHARLV